MMTAVVLVIVKYCVWVGIRTHSKKNRHRPGAFEKLFDFCNSPLFTIPAGWNTLYCIEYTLHKIYRKNRRLNFCSPKFNPNV